jgi:hypothetical protein
VHVRAWVSSTKLQWKIIDCSHFPDFPPFPALSAFSIWPLKAQHNMDVYKHWCKQWRGMRGWVVPLTNSGICMVIMQTHQCSHLAAMIGISLRYYSIILFCHFALLPHLTWGHICTKFQVNSPSCHETYPANGRRTTRDCKSSHVS